MEAALKETLIPTKKKKKKIEVLPIPRCIGKSYSTEVCVIPHV